MIGPTYDWYFFLSSNSITCFNDVKYDFLMRYSQPVSYYTLLSEFTQVHLQKNEKVQDFDFRFHQTLHRIPKDERPNQPFIFNYFKIDMSANVRYAIKAFNTTALEEAIIKAYEME